MYIQHVSFQVQGISLASIRLLFKLAGDANFVSLSACSISTGGWCHIVLDLEHTHLGFCEHERHAKVLNHWRCAHVCRQLTHMYQLLGRHREQVNYTQWKKEWDSSPRHYSAVQVSALPTDPSWFGFVQIYTTMENHKPLGYGAVYSHSACTKVLRCDQL